VGYACIHPAIHLVPWHHEDMKAHLHIFVNGRQFGPDDSVREVMTGGEIATLVGVPIGLAVVRLDPRIDPKDLRIDTRPSGRANTDCAVRITHLPSALVSVSDNETSQIRNRARAMQLLRIDLYQSGHVQPRRIATYEQIRIESGDHFSVSSL